MSKESYKLSVTFEGLTKPQVIALCNVFKTMEANGRAGHSEWVGFYSDGDGNFRPKVTMEHDVPDYPDKETENLLMLLESQQHSGVYDGTFVDYDNAAWLLGGNATIKSEFLERNKDNAVVKKYIEKYGNDGPVKFSVSDNMDDELFKLFSEKHD